MEKLKKILTILIFIIIVVLIGYAIYSVFFKPEQPPITGEPTPTFPSGLPTQPPTGLPITPTEPSEPGALTPSGIVIPTQQTPTITEPVISDRISGGLVISNNIYSQTASFPSTSGTSNGLNFYDKETGLFNRITPDGQIKILSSRSFPDVENVSWSPVSDKAVLEFPDGSNIIYDFVNDKSFNLPEQYEDFSFSPQGDQIAAKDLKLNPEDRWLVAVDSEGKNKTLIEHLGKNEKRVQVKWSPNNRIVGTSAESIDGNRAEVIFLTKDGSQLTKAIVQGRDLRYQYAPSGNKIVYSVYNSNSNYLPTLWLTSTNPSAIDQGRIDTGLNTWADKCTFANERTLYCAVPKEIVPRSGILTSLNDSVDNIYRIDTSSGEVSLAAEPITPTVIQSMSMSKDGNTIFYIDGENGNIKTISTK